MPQLAAILKLARSFAISSKLNTSYCAGTGQQFQNFCDGRHTSSKALERLSSVSLLLAPVLHRRDYSITGATMCHRKQGQVKCTWTDVDNEKSKKRIHPDLHKFLLDSSPKTVWQIENLLAIISQRNTDGFWVTNQEHESSLPVCHEAA